MLSYVILSFFLGIVTDSLLYLLNLPAICLIFPNKASSQTFFGLSRLVLFIISWYLIVSLSNLESCSPTPEEHCYFGEWCHQGCRSCLCTWLSKLCPMDVNSDLYVFLNLSRLRHLLHRKDQFYFSLTMICGHPDLWNMLDYMKRKCFLRTRFFPCSRTVWAKGAKDAYYYPCV